MTGAENSFDVVGIGFGPSNIALAVALQEADVTSRVLFVETKPVIAWHPNMLLAGTDIQHNPHRDLVTLVNPRSRFTFINYLFESGRLIDYFNLGATYPLRKEYSSYLRWVGEQFDNVRYGSAVAAVSIEPGNCGHPRFHVALSDGNRVICRGLVVAGGRTPFVPAVFRTHLGDRIFHFTEYLGRYEKLERLRDAITVAVVGGSQSAIEVVLDLRSRRPNAKIVNIMRGFGYRLRETSPFTRRVFMPEFIDYFYALPDKSKRRLREQLNTTNYSVADAEAIQSLNVRLYEDRLDGRETISLAPNLEVVAVREVHGGYELSAVDLLTRQSRQLTVDAVILATGFVNIGGGPEDERDPPILRGLADRFGRNADGSIAVNRDYSLRYAEPSPGLLPCWLNGLCEASHGLGDAGTISAIAHRAQLIAHSIGGAVHATRS